MSLKPVFGDDCSNFPSNFYPTAPATFIVVGSVEWRPHLLPWAGPPVDWSLVLHQNGAWIYLRDPYPSLAPAALWLLASADGHVSMCFAGFFPWCLQQIKMSPNFSQIGQWWVAPLCWQDLPLVLHLLPDSASLLKQCQEVSLCLWGPGAAPLVPRRVWFPWSWWNLWRDTSPLHLTMCSSFFSAGLSPVSGTLHHILPLILKQGGRQGPILLLVFPRDYLVVPPTNSYLDSV